MDDKEGEDDGLKLQLLLLVFLPMQTRKFRVSKSGFGCGMSHAV
jgi:hypothetical protein